MREVLPKARLAEYRTGKQFNGTQETVVIGSEMEGHFSATFTTCLITQSKAETR
jgi:hypothetical protein